MRYDVMDTVGSGFATTPTVNAAVALRLWLAYAVAVRM